MLEAAESAPPTRLYPTFATLFGVTAVGAALFALGLFLFSLLGRYFFYAELLGNFRLQLLIFMTPFALLTLAARRWWMAGCLTLAIAWSLVVAGIFPIPRPALEQAARPLRILSYNVLAQNQNCDAVIGRMLEQAPDVIVALEYANHWHAALNALNDEYPYQTRHPRWHGFGAAIFSKYPLTNLQRMDLLPQRTDSPMPIADIQYQGQAIRIAAVHVISPMNSYRLQLRNQQFQEIADALVDRNVPTVVLGDFNCTPWSPFLIDFLAQTGYRDSRTGFGYQASWHSTHWFLGIPIDHAFVSDELQVHDRQIGRTAGSDHFPIILDVSIKPQK